MNSCSSLIRFYSCFLLAAFLITSCTEEPIMRMPLGWYPVETVNYQMGVDESTDEADPIATIRHIGNPGATIETGVLMQSCNPEAYRGKRVSMHGRLKTRDAGGWAGFWMRVEQEDSLRLDYFDNMEDRGIKGTSSWKDFEIVLDVPSNATRLSFGGLLVGSGQMWFGNLQLQAVPITVPVTSKFSGVMQIAANTHPEKEIDFSKASHAEILDAVDERKKQRFVCMDHTGFGPGNAAMNLALKD